MKKSISSMNARTRIDDIAPTGARLTDEQLRLVNGALGVGGGGGAGGGVGISDSTCTKTIPQSYVNPGEQDNCTDYHYD